MELANTREPPRIRVVVRKRPLTSKELSKVMFIVTGGIGVGKTISEADAMKKLLIDSGISDGRIIIEDQSSDTLSSVVYCQAILNTRNNPKYTHYK